VLSISAKSDAVEVHDMLTSKHVQSLPIPGKACDMIDCRHGNDDFGKGRNPVQSESPMARCPTHTT
jgi:hypothetical protein